jgi:hypothetical protein
MLTIRYGTADCAWGYPVVSAYNAKELDERKQAFRKHCVERHGFCGEDLEAWLDLQNWTLTMMR